DGDEAGQKAMERALEILLPAGLRVRAVILPEGSDPDDYLADRGAQALRDIVDGARDAVDLVIQRVMRSGASRPGEKADAVRGVAHLVAAIEDPVERSEYARRLAMGTATDPVAVEAVVRDERRGRATGRDENSGGEKIQPRRSSPEDRHLRMLGSILSRHPEFASKDLATEIERVLPEGPWKALILELVDAGSAGVLDEMGAIDFDAMEQRLCDEQLGLFREVVVEDSVLSAETPARTVLGQLLDRYRVKDLEAREQELKRRLGEPDADHAQLLAERQKLIEHRKAMNRGAFNQPP
ncbi:MAG: toprim domain-containing protein, partial [Myxococcota bacterium]